LRRATTYTQTQRIYFRRCFSNGIFEIDNGRLNDESATFLSDVKISFSPAPSGVARRLAVAYTLVDNCNLLGIDPRGNLHETIDKLEQGHAPITTPQTNELPEDVLANSVPHPQGNTVEPFA
jgi:hypothetical protein